MSDPAAPIEPSPHASRKEWTEHLYRLWEQSYTDPESTAIWDAIDRAYDAIRRLDYPAGYGPKERLAERIQDARYAAGIDVIGEK